MNLLSETLAYFYIDSKMKLFFPALFSSSAKNYTIIPTIISIFISVIISSFSLSLFLHSMFSQLLSLFDQVIFLAFISVCSNFKRVTTCMVKKSYTSKAKIYISFFFFLVLHTPSPTHRFVIILLYPHTYTLALSQSRISILYKKI